MDRINESRKLYPFLSLKPLLVRNIERALRYRLPEPMPVCCPAWFLASNPTPQRTAGLKQQETLLCVFANGVYGVKQSPRTVGDCHVAKSAPRRDIVLSFLSRKAGAAARDSLLFPNLQHCPQGIMIAGIRPSPDPCLKFLHMAAENVVECQA